MRNLLVDKGRMSFASERRWIWVMDIGLVDIQATIILYAPTHLYTYALMHLSILLPRELYPQPIHTEYCLFVVEGPHTCL
jgi:hypothetical protein